MKSRSRRRRPKLFLKGKSSRARRHLLVVFALVFGATAAPRARASCVEFASPLQLLPALGDVTSVVAGDVDRDGDQDLLVAADNDSLAWYLANNGSWSVGSITFGAHGVRRAEAGDIDNDGDLDVLAAAPDDATIFWFEGAGNGTGWNVHTVASDLQQVQLAHLIDVDHDGDLDVVARDNVLVPDKGPEGLPPPFTRLAIYQNLDGGGTFGPSSYDSLPGSDSSYSILSGDLDRDGDEDLVEASFNQPLVWLANLGGGFSSPQTISTIAPQETAVAVADLDRDGDLDLVAASFFGGRVRFYENSAGNASSWFVHTVTTSQTQPTDLAAADVDSDGDLDVVVSSLGDVETAWYENDGDAGGWTRHTLSTATFGSTAVAAADLDGDGDADIVGGATTALRLGIHRNDLLGTDALFGEVRSISTTAVATRGLRVADFDRDGDLDPLLVNGSNAAIDAWTNDGVAGSFGFRELTGFLELGDDLQMADLDADGDLDFVAPTDYLAALLWFRNNGAAVTTNLNIDTVLTDPVSAALGDLSGDGRPDVAVADKTLDAVFWYRNDGTPASGVWTRLTVASGIDGVSKIVAADVDRDGDLDLLANAPATDKAILWLDSNGAATPTFTRRTLQTLAGTPAHFAPADVDRDGDLDLWVLSGGEMLWLESDSTPASGAWTIHSVGTAAKPGGLESADLDHDGDPDLIVTDDDAQNGFQMFENLGGGAFAKRTAVSINAPRRVVAADLDRDGDLDLALATNNAVLWAPNLGTKIFDEGGDSDGNTACWSTSVPLVP